MNTQQITEEPVLQYAILCDAVAKDQSGKPVYIGAFDRLTQIGILPQFVVAVKWICGIGDHKFSFRILDPHLKEVSPIQGNNNFKMALKTKTDTFYANRAIINFNFNTQGVYWVEFFLNDKAYLAVPLPVHKS